MRGLLYRANMAGYKGPSMAVTRCTSADIGEAGLDFEDLVTALEPPPNRVGKSDGAHEHHLYEGAVMVAYAMHLLRTEGARASASIPTASMESSSTSRAGWCGEGFAKVSSLGSTAYGGIYRNREGQTITVNPRSGLGDVVAESATRSSRPSARAASSTRGIPVRCRGSTKDFVRRSEC